MTDDQQKQTRLKRAEIDANLDEINAEYGTHIVFGNFNQDGLCLWTQYDGPRGPRFDYEKGPFTRTEAKKLLEGVSLGIRLEREKQAEEESNDG